MNWKVLYKHTICNEDFQWTGKFEENCWNQSTEVRFQLNQLWEFENPFEYSDASHRLESWQNTSNLMRTRATQLSARNVNYIFGTNYRPQTWDGNTVWYWSLSRETEL